MQLFNALSILRKFLFNFSVLFKIAFIIFISCTF